MKCHILFSEKNKKNISKCRLLKILPRVLSVKYAQIFLNENWHTVSIETAEVELFREFIVTVFHGLSFNHVYLRTYRALLHAP